MKAVEMLRDPALYEALKNPAEASRVITALQDAMDEIATAFLSMKMHSENLSMSFDKVNKIAADNEKACIDLTQTIKHIHIALNGCRDQIPEQLVALTDELGKFVMSGAAIKAGVKANANA